MTSETPPTIITFVVRVHRVGDALHGVVERVTTREKEPFREPAEIGRIVRRFVEDEARAAADP
jgi:hypothetical protein